MIEVFKTNVQRQWEAEKMISILSHHFPCSKINFDLSDCDNILRVEGEKFAVDKIVHLVNEHGYYCDVLDSEKD